LLDNVPKNWEERYTVRGENSPDCSLRSPAEVNPEEEARETRRHQEETTAEEIQTSPTFHDLGKPTLHPK
jgi:hypothetical protein